VIINKYGITLNRLTKSDLELIRVNRNSLNIRKQMFYQSIISKEMQNKWFTSINNINNYYFIVNHNCNKIGLINLKDIDFERRTGEGGLFIWNEKYLKTYVPILSSICFIDFAFNILKLKEHFSQVKETNLTAIRFNENLGYRLHFEEKKIGKLIYTLTKDNYYKKADKIRETVMRIGKDCLPLSWDDISLKGINSFEKENLYTKLPLYVQNEINKKIN
jgi:UDP-4-amino-4,6-dideoxy-N-acetyl-beta-L-altrosamine N-acetyltransferase